MWFKHRAWILITWFLSVANLVATWFAAAPGEAWHATTHALLATLFAVAAQRLAARQTGRESVAGGEARPEIAALRGEINALGEAQSEILNRVERAVDSIAIEVERVGEAQRFLTKALADPDRAVHAPNPAPDPSRQRT